MHKYRCMKIYNYIYPYMFSHLATICVKRKSEKKIMEKNSQKKK